MIVQEIEMASRQAVDLGQGLVDPLGIETPSALEEGVLVTEVAVLRTSARDDDGVRNQVALALDQIAPDGRQSFDRSALMGDVAGERASGAKVPQELGK